MILLRPYSWVVPFLACNLVDMTGCSGGHGTQRSLYGDAPGTFVRSGAPHPYGCQADAECIPGPLVNPEDGCCDTGVPLRVFSRAYLAWRARWVAQNCAGIRCPAIPSPGLPLPCAFKGRCLGGRCMSRCGGAPVR